MLARRSAIKALGSRVGSFNALSHQRRAFLSELASMKCPITGCSLSSLSLPSCSCPVTSCGECLSTASQFVTTTVPQYINGLPEVIAGIPACAAGIPQCVATTVSTCPFVTNLTAHASQITACTSMGGLLYTPLGTAMLVLLAYNVIIFVSKQFHYAHDLTAKDYVQDLNLYTIMKYGILICILLGMENLFIEV